MKKKTGTRKIVRKEIAVLAFIILTLNGCVSTSRSAISEHENRIEKSVADKTYHIPKRPVDRHYIGRAWSKQFGPIEDPNAPEIRVKKEKSFNDMQQDFAYKVGLGLGAKSIVGPMGEVGIEGGKIKKAKLKGVEIITPVSIADIPFEPKIPYITKALRLAGFKLTSEAQNKFSISASAGSALGSGSALAEAGSKGRTGTSGDGLVVAYQLHEINRSSYKKEDYNPRSLELDERIDFPEANITVTPRLQLIKLGAKKSLPRNLLWACKRAEAKSRDMVAAWLVSLKFTDGRRKSLTIAFPGYPEIEDCQNFKGIIFSKIDPLKDRIHRQKINIFLNEAELSDQLKPKTWDATITLIDESFKIKLVPRSRL